MPARSWARERITGWSMGCCCPRSRGRIKTESLAEATFFKERGFLFAYGAGKPKARTRARTKAAEMCLLPTRKFSPKAYCPVPVTFKVCRDGVALSVTVIAAARVTTALGVKVTVKVHCAFAANVDEHGVAPPGVAA